MSEPKPDFEAEIKEVQDEACAIIRDILTVNRNNGKYGAYVWATEPLDRHLLKGSRHAMTACMQRHGFATEDGEDHLAQALSRLALAAASRKRKINAFKASPTS
jgi:hypothetical protein